MKKNILILLLACLIALSFATVSASDVNETVISQDNSDLVPINEININQKDEEIVSVNNIEQNDYLSIDKNSSNNNLITASNDLANIINTAESGSVIELNSDYTYSTYISFVKNITINGKGHTFNGNKQGSILIDEGASVQLINIKFTNFKGYNNGGVFRNFGNLTLINCNFENNYASDVKSIKYDYERVTGDSLKTITQGGAIYNAGTLNIIKSNFNKNFAESKSSSYVYKFYPYNIKVYSDSYGGAIYNIGNLNIIDSNFNENYANSKSYGYSNNDYINTILIYSYSYGGAIYNEGNLIINNTKFNGNIAQSEDYAYCNEFAHSSKCFSNSHGGAIYNSVNLTIEDSSFITNTAQSYSIINDNSSYDDDSNSRSYAGAIFNSGYSKFVNVMMDNNMALIFSNFFKLASYQSYISNHDKVFGGSVYNAGELVASDFNINALFAAGSFNAKYSSKVRLENYQEIHGSFIYNCGKLTMNANILYDDSYFKFFASNYIYYAEQGIYGGLICNEGRLNMFNTTFKCKSDVAVSSLLNNNEHYRKFIYGGLIYNIGRLNMDNSSFINNYHIYDYSWVYGSYIYNGGSFILTNSSLSVNCKNASIVNEKRISIYGYNFKIYDSSLNGFNITNSKYSIEISNSDLVNVDLINEYCNLNIIDSLFTNVVINHENNNLTIFNSNVCSTNISIEKSSNQFYNITFKETKLNCFNVNLSITKCNFLKSSNINGGAILCDESYIEIFNSSFVNNSANSGGAIYVSTQNNELNIFNSTFIGNNAYNSGGAIYNWGHVNIFNSSFVNNSAKSGGAISYVAFRGSTNKCDMNIFNSSFIENKAFNEGGALNVYELNVNNCIFINNSASSCAAIKVRERGLINHSLFYMNYINKNKNEGNYICYLVAGNVTNSIFLNNTANLLFSNSSSFDYNWFGSTLDDYLIKPIIDSALNNWAFLNISHEKLIFIGENSIPFLFKVYDGDKIIRDNYSSIYQFELTLECTNGELDKTLINSNENVMYTSNKIGSSTITVKFFDNNFKINLNSKYPSKIIANESITVFVDQFINFDNTGLSAKLIPYADGELIYSSDDYNILNITNNGFKGLISGTANIIIEFKGNNEYAPTKEVVPITVLKCITEINTTDTIILNYKDLKTIDVNLIPYIGCGFVFSSADENIATVDNTGLIEAIGVGNTTINIIFKGNEKYYASNKTIELIVNKRNSSIGLKNDIEFKYGSSGYTVVNFIEGCGEFNATVLNHPEAKVTSYYSKITVSNLDVGEYTLIVTAIPSSKNFAPVNVTCLISVSKALAKPSITTKNFVYNSSIIVDVTCDGAIGLSDVEIIDHPEASISINNTSIIISGLDVGDYTLVFSTDPDKNHIGVIRSYEITINKANSEINFSNNLIFDYGSSNNTIVNTKYATNITNVYVRYHPEAIINIEGNIITVSGLNVGKYTLCVSTVPDKNHKSVIGTIDIIVNKAYSTINVEKSIVFDYGGSDFTYVTFNGANNIKATIDDTNAIVIVVNNKIIVSNLNAGIYTLNVSTVPDKNHVSVSDSVKVIVNKANPTIDISPVIFDYNEYGSTNILTDDDIDFEAKIINHPEANIDIYDKMIYISNLNAGNYKLELSTFSTKNYNPHTVITDITVNKIQSTINVPYFISCDYGKSCLINVALNGANKFNANINGDSTHLSTIDDGLIMIFGLNAGIYDLTITTIPDDNHNSVTTVSKIFVNHEKSTDAVNVAVKKVTPKITAKSKTFKKSVKTKKYSITLKNNLNKVMKNTKVILKVKGKYYIAKTNKKGIATFKITKLTKKGAFKSVITYMGNTYYNKVSKSVTIKIK